MVPSSSGSSLELGGAGESAIIRSQRFGSIFAERALRVFELKIKSAPKQIKFSAALDGS
jgi:hypothetical protein